MQRVMTSQCYIKKNQIELHMTVGVFADAKSDDISTLRQKKERELHMTAGVIADAKSDDISTLCQKKRE
jgi:hypothetical protein